MKKSFLSKRVCIIIFAIIIMVLVLFINQNNSPENVIMNYVEEENSIEIVDVRNYQDASIYLLKVDGINSIIVLDKDNEVVDYIRPSHFSNGGNRGEDIYAHQLSLDNGIYVIVSHNPDLHTIVFKGNDIKFTEIVTTTPYFTIIDPYFELNLDINSNHVEFEYYFLDANNNEIR